MAAPERFADTSDSSCTAGAVHTWPETDVPWRRRDVCFRGRADLIADGVRSGCDPLRTWTAWNCCSAIAPNARFGSGSFLI